MQNNTYPHEIKVIVCDLDNTLAYHDHDGVYGDVPTVHKDNVEIVKWARSQGILFTVATGRSIKQIQKIHNLPELDLPAIASNGGVIYDFNKNQMIKDIRLNNNDVINLFKFFEDKDQTFYIYGDQGEAYYWHNFKLKEAAHGKGLFEYDAQYIDDPYEFMKKTGIGKMCFTDLDVEYLTNLHDTIIKENVLSENSYIVFSAAQGFEVNPIDGQKGNGLIYLSQQTGIPLESFMVFGDAMNDASMFKQAGVKVAMSNADPKLKQMPDVCVTDNTQHNGIALFLKSFFNQ